LPSAKLAIADSWFREGGTQGAQQAYVEYKDFILFYRGTAEAKEAQVRLESLKAQYAGKFPDVNPVSATPYKKWIDQDVAYIIGDEERKAFEQLRTDEEREKFVEQFWARRDPTPGTPENEFKQEHYRRMASVNERYSANGIEGWQTDRGRIYIQYGPPDEIESHPIATSNLRPADRPVGPATYPFQQWLYRHIDGIGDNIVIEFVDKTGNGEYRMTMDPSAKDALPLPTPGR
jgi:GWxTD domain-containing protein